VSDAAVNRVPIQAGLFRWPSESPRLLASRCRACGELCFPQQESCPACTARDAESVELSPRGRLWTFTIQRFPPPTPPWIGPSDPGSFVPFGVGYVELPEGIRVEGRLTENDPAKLEIGMEMELVVEKFQADADGNELVTFAFRPVPKPTAPRRGGRG
jgi:uncharacterized OB-fold protein